MDQIILYLAALLGINPLLLPVYLGLIIAVANVLGKSIPASAEGPLGFLRAILLIIGLYKPQQITSTVTTKTIAKAIASEVPDAILRESAKQLPATIGEAQGAGLVAMSLAESAADGSPFVKAAKRATSRTTNSHWLAGIGSLIMALLLMGCTTDQIAKVDSVVNTVCTSAPLAQALYNSAVASGDHNRVNQLIGYMQVACPAVLILIHTVPVKPAEPVVTAGERG